MPLGGVCVFVCVQVIGVYGVNPTGQTIIAHKVCNSLPAPRAAAVAPRARPVSVMVAAGPFTTSNDLCYVPLEQILEHCAGEYNRVARLCLHDDLYDMMGDSLNR